MSDDTRLTAIETALSHHDRQIGDLNDIITAQWKEIERLKRLLAKAEEKLDLYMEEAKSTEGLTSAEIAARDKPPHY